MTRRPAYTPRQVRPFWDAVEARHGVRPGLTRPAAFPAPPRPVQGVLLDTRGAPAPELHNNGHQLHNSTPTPREDTRP